MDKPRITHDQLAALAAAPTRVQPPKPAGGGYTFRHACDGVTTEVVVQTHAEFVAFVNWFHGKEAVPLAALAPEVPQVF